MSAIDAHSPDHLAFLAYGFDDFQENNHRYDVPIEGEKLSSASRFLDSLAHLAVFKSNQVVAVGADLKDSGVDIVVAENNEVEPQVTQHLQYIMNALFDIRQVYNEENLTAMTPSTSGTQRLLKSLGFIKVNDTRPVPSLLRQLELSILRHSFPTISARIRKGGCYRNFMKRANRFLVHCNGSSSPSDEDTYVGPLAELKKIEIIIMLVTNLYMTTKNPLEPTEKELEVFRVSSTFLDTILVKSPADVKALDEFCRLDDGPQAKLWLSEISSSRLHFARVASIVDSSTFSDFLRHRPTIHPLENFPPPLSFTITRASFIAILEAAEWAPHNEDARDVMIDDVYIQLAKKLRMLSMDPSIQGQITIRVRNATAKPSVADEFDVVTLYGAHCECVVLAYLRDAALRPATFVGVSEPSCRLCREYFGIAGETYHTRGSQRQVARWRCPVGSPPETRRVMEERVLAVVKEKVTIVCNRSSSRRWNDDFSVDNVSDFDDVIWQGYTEFCRKNLTE